MHSLFTALSELSTESYVINCFLSLGIEECSSEGVFCAENANCVNNQGNYTCVCASGYTGDGFSNCARSRQSETLLPIIMGIVIAGLALIALAVIIINVVLLCRMKRKKLPVSEHVSNFPNTQAILLESNAAYITVSDREPTIHDATNEVYTLPTSVNEAHGTLSMTNDDIVTSTNDAYVTTDILTCSNKAYQTTERLSRSNVDEYTYDYVLHST